MPLPTRAVPSIGQLRDWLDLFQPTWSMDPGGGLVPGEPTFIARVPAYVEGVLDADERVAAAAPTVTTQWAIWIRHRVGVTAEYRAHLTVTFSGDVRNLEVLSVRPVPPHWLELVCAEAV